MLLRIVNNDTAEIGDNSRYIPHLGNSQLQGKMNTSVSFIEQNCTYKILEIENTTNLEYDSVQFTKVQSQNSTDIYPTILASSSALTLINILVGTPANILICSAVLLNK